MGVYLHKTSLEKIRTTSISAAAPDSVDWHSWIGTALQTSSLRLRAELLFLRTVGHATMVSTLQGDLAPFVQENQEKELNLVDAMVPREGISEGSTMVLEVSEGKFIAPQMMLSGGRAAADAKEMPLVTSIQLVDGLRNLWFLDADRIRGLKKSMKAEMPRALRGGSGGVTRSAGVAVGVGGAAIEDLGEQRGNGGHGGKATQRSVGADGCGPGNSQSRGAPSSDQHSSSGRVEREDKEGTKLPSWTTSTCSASTETFDSRKWIDIKDISFDQGVADVSQVRMFNLLRPGD